MSIIVQEVVQSVRSLRRSVGFSVAAVVTLALGISSTTAIFSVVNSVLLAPLPFPAADRIVVPESMNLSTGQSSYFSYADFMSGLGLRIDESLTGASVDDVVPGSPATDAGLAVGDTLVSIDGQPATAAAIHDLRKRFRRVGERIVLTVRRGGQTRTVTLVLRRLV